MSLTITKTNQIEKPFRWITRQGESLDPATMETRHLVYSLRMIYNHVMPAQYQIPGGVRYSNVGQWPLERLRRSAVELSKIAFSRSDLTNEHRRILEGMRLGFEAHQSIRLT